jgi:hypothetical protein
VTSVTGGTGAPLGTPAQPPPGIEAGRYRGLQRAAAGAAGGRLASGER